MGKSKFLLDAYKNGTQSVLNSQAIPPWICWSANQQVTKKERGINAYSGQKAGEQSKGLIEDGVGIPSFHSVGSHQFNSVSSKRKTEEVLEIGSLVSLIKQTFV